MLRLVTLMLFFLAASPARADDLPDRFAVAVMPTPVFNSPQIQSLFGGSTGRSLKLDRCGQIRELEFIALTGTDFRVHEEIAAPPVTTYRVTTADYPYPTSKGYYIDSRCVRITSHKPPERTRQLPSREAVMASLRSAAGLPYVWGGNVRQGIPEMLTFYPPDEKLLSDSKRSQWQLKGLDCSGLLYEASGGWTPRNTSSLVNFGQHVDVAGRSPSSIARLLQPLDLIVWPGHVLIVLDKGEVIESILNCNNKQSGVIISRLAVRLAEIMRRRQPTEKLEVSAAQNDRFFVARRWYGVTSTPADISF